MAIETTTVASTLADETTLPVAPKFEVKEGVMLVDGKKVIHESDLIATKRSLEGQIEKAQGVHNAAIDRAKLDLSDTQSKLATANAKVQELETAQSKAVAANPEDAAKQAAALKTAQDKATKVETDLLGLRIKNILLQYPGQLTDEQLKSKTPDQLTALEEALKAITTSRGGAGPYAINAGGGGGTAPLTDFDRAKALLAATPLRGERKEPNK